MTRLIAFNKDSIKIKRDYEYNVKLCPKCKNIMTLKGDCEEPMCFYACKCGYSTKGFYI